MPISLFLKFDWPLTVGFDLVRRSSGYRFAMEKRQNEIENEKKRTDACAHDTDGVHRQYALKINGIGSDTLPKMDSGKGKRSGAGC